MSLKSNSFVAATEQVCLQPVLEHRQRRGRRNIAWQAIPHLCPATGKGQPPIVNRRQLATSLTATGNSRAAWDHTVTCHPADVTFPPLLQPKQAGTRLSDPAGDARLS